MKRLFSIWLFIACVSFVYADNVVRLSQLNLARAMQTYGSPAIGTSVTGEQPFVAGKVCEDVVGVQSKSVIRINVKGFAHRLTGMIGIADSHINYSGADISSNPQPDGTRLFYRKVGDHRYFAGVESKNGRIEKGKALFRIVGDGKELFHRMMASGESAQPVDINLKGIKSLELIVDEGDGTPSGDFALWIGTKIEYDGFQAMNISTQEAAQVDPLSPAVWAKLQKKLHTLPVVTLPLPRASYDWLLDASKAKAAAFAGNDGKSIIITNGLTARVFRLTPNLATIDIVNQMTGENMLRAVSGEGELVLNGETWNIGGLQGQPERGYIKPEWIDQMTAIPNSFVVEDFEVSDKIDVLDWARSRWALNKKNPTGKRLTFTLRGSNDMKDVVVKLYFDIYDSVPVIRKSMQIFNEGSNKVNLASFKLEHLFFAEPESTGGDMSKNYMPNIHVESDFACGGDFWEYSTDRTEHWTTDKEYTSQCNYGLNTLCTLDVNLNIGPDADITKEEPFTSYHVYEMPIDSYDRERKGLFKRRFYSTIVPWTTENPIFMHLTTIDPATVHRAVDQCAETGYEMIILSFGSGMNVETTNPEHVAAIKSLVDYAHSKGIEMGGYSLCASRWISDDVDVINPATGKRGGATFGSAPCLCSDWGVNYLNKIKSFYQKTGLTLLEHDGSYPGDVCASTKHTYHKGLNDSQWKQFGRITDLYHWMLAKGISLNVPDFYFLNGSTKVSIGYKETNWSLPRDRQLIHSRQVNYTGTFDRTASMCWSFVPLVEYHGGGAAATLEPLSEHLETYKQIMMENYGAGVQACYRGPRLYDTDATKEVVKGIIDWYKKYRVILNSDIIHLRKADGRDWDGILHVNPHAKEKGLALFFNPTNQEMMRSVKLPLYYTGLSDKAKIRCGEEKPNVYKLNRDYSVNLTIRIPANSYTWYVVE